MSVSRRVRFCSAPDGTALAFAVAGTGPALLESAYCLNHLEYSPENAVWRRWIAELSRNRTYVRYDARGFGVSDPAPRELSFDALVADIGTVANAAGLERFALVGHSSAAAAAVAYAALNPARVTHLLLCSAYARGLARREAQTEEGLLYQRLVQFGWNSRDGAFRQVFQSQFAPDAPHEAHAAHEELQLTMSPANVVRYMALTEQIDVSDLARRVACPTLVVHSRGDLRVSVEEVTYLARLIPDSRLVLLPSRNRILWEGEPAWARFAEEVRGFLPSGPPEGGAFAELTAREREVLELVARGLDNHQIAARLEISEKTVRNVISAVLDKLAVESRSAAIVHARKAGYGADSAS